MYKRQGYKVHTLFNISEVVEILQEVDHLTEEEVERINDFINGNKIQFKEERRLSYEQKLLNAEHTFAKKLLEITINKNSNPVSYTHLDVYKRQILPKKK